MEQNIIESKGMRLLSIPEACERLGVGRNSIYQLFYQGTLRPVKIGRRTLVSDRGIDEFIIKLEQ
jgi:excisionase family DNA binding protein